CKIPVERTVRSRRPALTTPLSRLGGCMFRAAQKLSLLSCLAMAVPFTAVPLAAQTMTAPDITQQPTLYVVPYAHLDTQWRWEFPQVISEYLLKTMRVNFYESDKYTTYVFNW